MASFVIEYNRRTRARRVTEFATVREAGRYQLKLEEERTDRNVEIVAISAKSLDVIKHTHARYFPEETRNPEFWGVPAAADNAGEAISAGLQALIARDHAAEAWLHDEAAPAYDAALANPSRAVATQAVRARLAAEQARNG